MLADLIATDNYLNFNIKLANLIGLHAAVYVAELTNIYTKAYSKKKLDDKNNFIVDRSYIKQRTTLEIAEQKEIDKSLINLDLLKVDKGNVDKLNFDFNRLASIVTSEDINLINNVKDLTNTKNNGGKKQTQRQVVINKLKSIASHPNEELDQAYKDWVDGVYANPKGFLSNRSIKIFMQSVDDYAKGDLDLALKIIEIATVNGYRECQWAINVFEKDFKRAFYQNRIPQQPATQNQATGNRRIVDLSDEVY